MTTTPEHKDAARLERAAQGLPPDVHDPATEAAYQALQRPAAGGQGKGEQPEATPKGGEVSWVVGQPESVAGQTSPPRVP
jgi:hypothetical protein